MRAINYSSVIEEKKRTSEQIKRHENYHWKKVTCFLKCKKSSNEDYLWTLCEGGLTDICT